MNAKLKKILQTGWTEPRHFFFWLTLFGLCGLAVLMAVTTWVGAGGVLGWAALLCLAVFALSLPAFVLSWIPPLRRLFAWVLQRRFLALAALVTLVALFYAVENWRGRSAWQGFKQQREAAGEKFELSHYIPPEVPADQNFFESPLWTNLRYTVENGHIVWSDTNWGNEVTFTAFGPNANDAPKIGNWAIKQRVDLAEWQAFYRGTNNLFTSPGGGPDTNYFPVAPQPQSPAADVLLALSKFEHNRQLLIDAANRPHARFWINYDSAPGMLLPHLARAKALAQFLSLHACAALKAGDPETAIQDVRALLKTVDAIRTEPILISQLVRIAMLQIAMQPIWEGLADRQWREPDLRTIETELARLDFAADYHLTMRGERAVSIWIVDYIRRTGSTALEQLGMPDEPPRKKGIDFEEQLGQTLFELIPAGWFNQNKLSLCRSHESFSLPSVNRQQGTFSPRAARQAAAAEKHIRTTPYDLFSRMLIPAYSNASGKFARAQAVTHLARVACALERYRAANGRYPATLQDLQTGFLAQLPQDVIGGQALTYRLESDGQFLLYSVGWDETDSGGKPGLTSRGNADWEKGDWVWQYPG